MVYDTLHRRPRLHRALPREQEALARAIVASGRLRIETDDGGNFMRLNSPADQINIALSSRELNDAGLKPRTEKMLLAQLSRRNDAATAKARLEYLLQYARNELKKRRGVSADIELRMARALVLCNALPVIRLIHLEGAEIFISFGFEVGDVMDIVSYGEHGRNSGLQAVGRGENAVYVSCGGDPFREGDARKYVSDGFPALARFMIIAGQETGHNADMIRGPHGEWTGRYSATNWDRAPSPVAGKARRDDIRTTQALFDMCSQRGMHRVAEWERRLVFYREQKLRNLRRAGSWLLAKLGWLYLRYLVLKPTPGLRHLQRSATPATQLRIFFRDMLENLTPTADVYKRKNASEEEAISCIEAVARVPQQVNKWGHKAVRQATPGLYGFYYGVIVPACKNNLALLELREK